MSMFDIDYPEEFMTPLTVEQVSSAITLFDYQEEDRAKVASAFLDKHVTRQLGVWPTGCHAAGQGILMHDGTIKAVEDVGVGDYVMGVGGKAKLVYSLRRGYGKMYLIRPLKGEPWVVNEDHVLTLVRTREGGRRKDRDGELIDVTVKNWLTWTKTQKHLHKLVRSGRINFAPNSDDRLPLHPYFLGVLLGDGGISRGANVTTNDVEIFTECLKQARNLGLETRVDGHTALTIHFSANWERSNRLLCALESLGLRRTTSDNKFIPMAYKRAQATERLQLLAGLMDTDGSMAQNGFDYVSKSLQLATDVAYVARSLGLAAYVSPCYKKCQTGAVGVYHRVSISGDCSEIPTRLRNKQAANRQQKKSVLRTSFIAEPLPGYQDFYGFTLDGDHRYLLDDFTITHNSGKTVLFSELHMEPRMEAWLDSRFSWKRKILVIAHRDELIQQAVDKIKRSNPTLKIGVEKAEKRHESDDDVVVASVQTLTASKGKRLRQMVPDEYAIVVIDEAHHAAAPGYHVVLQHFGFLPPASWWESSRPTREEGRSALLEWQRDRLEAWDERHRPDRLLLGVTATAKRGDNVGLECVFQSITFNRSIREMIERGRLSKIRAYRVRSKTDIDHVSTRAGDLAQDELAKAVNEANRNAVAVRAYLDYAEGRKGITFCVNIAHAVSMANAYQLAGVSAKAIHGNLNDTERRRILEEYRRGEITMLTNCQILTEGFDEPDVQVIVHARPTKSSLLYIQMTGRGIRVAPGKTDCIVIDIVDITKKHSLMSAPELLGLPACFDAKGGDLLDLKQTFESIEAKNPLVDLTNAKDIEDVQLKVSEVDLFDSFHDENTDQYASLVWRKEDSGYTMDWKGALNNSSLTIEKDGDRWAFVHKSWLPLKTGRGAEQVKHRQTVDDVQTAFREAEKYLKTVAPQQENLKRKDKPWRKLPIMESQIKQLENLGVRANWSKMTKGDGADLLDKFWNDYDRRTGKK